MATPFHRIAFVLYKALVRPFKRTPARWQAIIFNEDGKFAIERGAGVQQLPSGRVVPGYPIPQLCRNGLGLDQSCFSADAPLRLIGVVGRGREGMNFYYSGDIIPEAGHTSRFESGVSYVAQSELGSFVPAEIAANLNPGP